MTDEMSYFEKPNLNELAYLAHYGIKGMRWGHHKVEETGPGRSSKSAEKSTSERNSAARENALAKEYMAIKEKPRNKEAAAKELAKNEQKFLAKANPSVEGQRGGLTDKQKALLKVGIGVAAVGGLVLYAKYSNNKQIAAMREMAGKKIRLEQFNLHTQHSKMKTWGFGGYIQDSSFARKEFTLPPGHTFHRISTAAEDSFKHSTYATHSIEDFNRYAAVFRHEKIGESAFHHVTFSAKEAIKVPSLATTLETMREAMSKDLGRVVTPAEAKSKYEFLSGGGWHPTHDKHVGSFFSLLQNKGYGAIVDEMDAGVIGDTPLVLFTKNLLSEKVSKPLTEEALNLAEKSLIEITNRKL